MAQAQGNGAVGRLVRVGALADLHCAKLRVPGRARRDGATAMPQLGQAAQNMAVYGTGPSRIGRQRAYEQDGSSGGFPVGGRVHAPIVR